MATETTTATMTMETTAATIEAPEKEEKISANKEKMNALHEKIEQGISEIIGGEKFKDYLDVTARVDLGYSNNVLVMQEKPEATRFEGFENWKKFDRHVAKDEKGIKIIAASTFVAENEIPQVNKITGKAVIGGDGKQANEKIKVTIPFFTPVTVFDVSQTYGKALPPPEVGKVKDLGVLFNALKEATPYKVELAEMENGARGNCSYTNKSITINENMSEVDIVKAAVQGITLTALHDKEAAKAEDLRATPDTMAIQTEAIAYTVCKHYGIDPPDLNVNRVAEWGADKDMEAQKGLLKAIHSTARNLTNSIDKGIIALTKDRVQEQAAEIPPPPQNEKSKPFGVRYNEIQDKKFLNINTADVLVIVEKLEAEGIKFSGIERDNGKTTLTVEAADLEAVRGIEKSINIIGNTDFKDLADRNYFPHDIDTAQKIAAALDEQGVSFSGRKQGNKITLTVGAADVEQYKAIEQALTAQAIVVNQPEIPAQAETVSLGNIPLPEAPLVKPEKPAKTEKSEKPEKPKRSINARIKEGEAKKKNTPKKETPEKSKSKAKAGQDLS
jgi:tRNA threonylcarbamoyladenosine modification (KEOPS) complex  Pcc1 subunit